MADTMGKKPEVLDLLKDVSELTPEEKQKASILIIEPDLSCHAPFEETLKRLGYGVVSIAEDEKIAEKRLLERHFSYVLVSVDLPNFPIEDFIAKLSDENPNLLSIVVSSDPDLDEIFDSLVVGAKGYLLKPFSDQTLEQAFAMATYGKGFSQEILKYPDREKALMTILMNNLDQVAEALHYSDRDETIKQELSKRMATLSHSVDLAVTFAKGGETSYLEKLEDAMITRSKEPATRLGRLRKRLARARKGVSSKKDS